MALAARSISRAGQNGTVQAFTTQDVAQLYGPDNPLEVISRAEKVELLKRVDAATRALDPRIQQVTVSMAGVWERILVASTDGSLAAEWRLPRLLEARGAPMSVAARWSRRRFLANGASVAAVTGLRVPLLLAEAAAGVSPGFLDGPRDPSLDGGWRTQVRPLLIGQTARPRRYAPDGDGFVIRNGREVFNRPMYCGSLAGSDGMRVDVGDLPEVSLFLPGHGGILRLGVARGDAATMWRSTRCLSSPKAGTSAPVTSTTRPA